MACWASRRGGSRGGGNEASPPVPLSLRERGNAGPATVVPRPGRPAPDGMRQARPDRGGLQERHRVRSTGRARGAADRAAHGAPRRAALPPRRHVRVSSSHHVGPNRSLRRVHGNRVHRRVEARARRRSRQRVSHRCARLRAAIRARLGQTVRIQQHFRHDRATPRRHALRPDAHLRPDARGAALEGRLRLRVPGARRRLPGTRERIRTAVRFPTHRDGPGADVSGARGGEGGRDRRQLDGRPDSGPGPRRVGGRPPLFPAVQSCAGDPAGSDHTAPGSGRGPRSARGPHLGRRDAAAQRPRGRRAPGYRDDRAGLAAGEPAVRVGPRSQLVLAAACFSTAGAAIKGSGFDAWQIAAVRAFVAMLAILALIPEARHRWSWHVGLVGLAYAAAGLLFVFANKLTTAANSVFLQATNPLFVVALAPWLLGERVRAVDLAFMGVLALGLALLFVGGQRHVATAPDPFPGNVLAAGSALAWAFTVAGYRWLARRGGADHGPIAAAAACGNLIVFLICLPGALPLASGRATDWLIVIYLGVFQLGLAYVFLPHTIIRTYFAITGLFNLAMSLIWGIDTLFKMGAGLDIQQVLLTNAAFTLGSMVFEVPTGVVADTLGRRVSLLLCLVTLFVTTLLYVACAWRGWGFWAFMWISVFLGLGYTFYTGDVDAWLVDALKATGYAEPLEPVFAKGQMFFGAGMLVGTIGGGLLGQIHLYIPYVVRAAIVVPLFALAWHAMPELGYTPRALELKRVPVEMRRVFVEGMEYGLHHPVVRPVMLASLVSMSFMIFGFYSWQRYFLDLLGRDLVWVSGVIAALTSLTLIAGNALVTPLTRVLRTRTGLLIGSVVVQTAAIVLCGLLRNFYVVVALYLVYGIALGVLMPVKQGYLNAHIPSAQRATIISLDSFFANLGGVAGQTGWGWLARMRSIADAWVAAGTALILGVPLYWLARRRDRQLDRF